MKKKHTLYMLIGPPLCGKTTWVKNNISDDFEVISRDDVMMSMCNSNIYNECYRLVKEKDINLVYNEKINKAIIDRKNIVSDVTNLKVKKRRSILSRIPKKEYNCIAVVFNWDLKELFKRNIKRKETENKYIAEHVIELMVNNYQKVIEEEGFDKIINVK